MDKFKKLNGSMKTILAATVVMVLTGTLVLLAAEKEERGYLGVAVQSLDRAEREKLGIKNGVEVVTVEKESAAAKAGMEKNDIIQLVNGEKIHDAQDLVDIISEQDAGKTVKIGLWRDGKALEVKASLGKRERSRHFAWEGKKIKMPRLIGSRAYLGVVLQELNTDLAAYFGVKASEGVLIVTVEKDTPADKAGLKAGDVIVQMGEKAVKDAAAVHKALADLKKGDVVAVVVVRHGKKETLKAEPEFNRHERIIRIFRGDKDMDSEHLEIPDLDIDIPEMDIEVPPLPDMSHIEEAMHHIHEKLDQAKVTIEKHLEYISESFWI
jgi:C-terminal processing protease CtpA/Prc